MRPLPVPLIAFALFFGGCASSSDHREWAQGFGGLELGNSAVRAQRVLDTLQKGLAGPRLHVEILRTEEISAYSFPDGSVFLTSGLMKRAGDKEIAAAIAHEMGHLLTDGHLVDPASLRGNESGLDVEAKADAVGCKVLEMHGISPAAMARMLQLVASDASARPCYDDLCRRICRLQVQISPQDR